MLPGLPPSQPVPYLGAIPRLRRRRAFLHLVKILVLSLGERGGGVDLRESKRKEEYNEDDYNKSDPSSPAIPGGTSIAISISVNPIAITDEC